MVGRDLISDQNDGKGSVAGSTRPVFRTRNPIPAARGQQTEVDEAQRHYQI
jgi:hypothetical protein